MTKEEIEQIKYKADLYMAVEFGFIWGRNMEYIKHAFIDGEDGSPQFSSNDYIRYKACKYEQQNIPRWLLSNMIYDDVMKYYQTVNKNNPDLQREVHYRISIILSELWGIVSLPKWAREIYDTPRYVITPFTKYNNKSSAKENENASRRNNGP